MSIRKIKKGDTVIAISGASRKMGKVMEVLPAKGRAIVEGVNLVKKTMRKSQENPQGGIIDKEAPIQLSNLMLYCPHDKKGVKVSVSVDGENKIRKCKICGQAFDG